MVSINYSSREVCCKIVYYGPGLSGKTTNLLYVHSKVPSDTRGKMISLATEADRTLYFDFLPINIGTINGFAAKFQLYTVPGQVYYNATRKLVLRGVDGVVFVADSQPDKMDENIESLSNLEDNLLEYGYDINELPIVIQYNKCDLPGVSTPEMMNPKLNPQGRPYFVASATVGNGVFDTLKGIIKLVLDKAKNTAASNSPKKPVENTPVIPNPEVAVATTESSQPEPPKSQPSGSEPVPTPAPEPVGVAAGAADSSEDDQYRPYPGSKTAGVKIQPEAIAPTMDTKEEETISKNVITEDAQTQTVSNGSAQAPQMAPSMKRRKEKKRGFFKRLFGIK